MQITENRIKVRDVYENYENDDEEGVSAMTIAWIFVPAISVNSFTRTRSVMP